MHWLGVNRSLVQVGGLKLVFGGGCCTGWCWWVMVMSYERLDCCSQFAAAAAAAVSVY